MDLSKNAVKIRCLFLIFSLLNILAVSRLKAQTGNLIGSDLSFLQLREGNLSNTLFTATGISLNYSKDYNFSENRLIISVQGSFANPKSPIEQKANSLYSKLGLSIDYFRRINTTKKIKLGGELLINYRGAYYNNFDQSHFFWTSFQGISPLLRYEAPISGKLGFKSSFKLPLIGLASRPEIIRPNKADEKSISAIFKQLHQKPEMVIASKYFNPSVKVELFYKLRNEKAVSAIYCFEGLTAQTSYSNKYREVNHCLGIQYSF